MRIFVALDINDGIRERIGRFIEGVRGFAPEARWVRTESLHVTLKFVGEKPAEVVEQVKQALSTIRTEAFDIRFCGYGFFPAPKSARVFWLGVESGPQLPSLAQAVDNAVHRLGIPAEDHPFSPHLTLARRGGGSGAPGWRKGDGPNRGFQVLRDRLAVLRAPEFGTMTTREFYLYESQLARGGARYTRIARFDLAQPTLHKQ